MHGSATMQLVQEAFPHLHDPVTLCGEPFAPLRHVLAQSTGAIAMRDTPETTVLLQASLTAALEQPLRLFSPTVRFEFAVSFGWTSLAVGIGVQRVTQVPTTTTLLRFPPALVRAIGAILHYGVGMSHDDLGTVLDIPTDTVRRLVYAGRANAAFHWVAMNGRVGS